MLVEMTDMMKKAPVGIVENVLEQYKGENGMNTIAESETTALRLHYYKRLQLVNECELRIGKKGYILEDIWEKCEHVHGGTLYSWHDDGFEEEERWESGLDDKYYDLPQVCIETFEVKRYSFEEGRRFVCVTKQ
ncbi:hypothetical protein Tco_0491349 [Tanacetum coccineum]